MASRGSGAAWVSLLVGIGSVATLPVAIYLTRFSASYELLHAGFAIPVCAGLGFAAIALSRRATRRGVLGLARDGRPGVARVGLVLGIVGLCMAAAALVSLGVYGLLEYVGSRD